MAHVFKGDRKNGTVRGRTSRWRRRVVLGVAAMLMICCGIAGLWYEEVLKDRRENDIKMAAARTAEICAMAEYADEGRYASEASPDEVADAGVCESGPEFKIECSAPELSGAGDPVGCKPADEPIAIMKSAITISSRCCVRSWMTEGANTTRGTLYRDGVLSLCVVSPSRSGECYAPDEEIGFLDPQHEPLSTFALDADTTSYALMRRDLTGSKRLPSRRSVRVEEYVNYFSYGYPQPADGEPVAVSCELAACPWNVTNRLLRVGVQAKRIERDAVPPCNFTFLVDVSGSMRGPDRLDLLKEALMTFVDRLRDEDHVAIVTCADRASLALPSVSGGGKTAIRYAIDELNARGGTAGGDGLQCAYAEAEKNFNPEANNRVIVVTDGDFNIGIRTPKQLQSFIADKRESGIFLTVLGVGRGNFKDAAMKALADAGNGNYAYLDSPEEARRVLLNEFSGSLVTVAKDVKVQLAFNPSEVRGYRLLGYENRLLAEQDFNDDGKDAGEIGAGHSMTAFYEIVPAGTGALFTVKMRYKQPNADESILREQAYTAAELTRTEPSEDFRFASAVAEFVLLLKDSRFKGTASFTNLIARAGGAVGDDPDGRRAEFVRLAETARQTYEKAYRVPQAIGSCFVVRNDDAAGDVWSSMQELKKVQADDGSWGTNRLADTAWVLLAHLSYGDLPGQNRTVSRGADFLTDAAETASDREVALTAYAFVWLYDISHNPDACDAAVVLFRRMKTMAAADPQEMLLRTEACWLALLASRGSPNQELAELADGLMTELMAWWRARDAKGDEIAFKCRALMLSDDDLSDDVFRLLDAMLVWKADDVRPYLVSLCATLCKYVAGVRADARPQDLQAWTAWDRAMKRHLKGRLATTVEVSEKAMIILHLTVPYRYWHTVLAPPKSPRPSVRVDVDI